MSLALVLSVIRKTEYFNKYRKNNKEKIRTGHHIHLKCVYVLVGHGLPTSGLL